MAELTLSHSTQSDPVLLKSISVLSLCASAQGSSFSPESMLGSARGGEVGNRIHIPRTPPLDQPFT